MVDHIEGQDWHLSARKARPDAEIIAHAINEGWIGRGFKLGIGFWLAGLFIGAVAFVFFAVGAALFAARSYPVSSFTAPAAAMVPTPPDTRSWQEQLEASDRDAAAMRENLKSVRPKG